ncbi:MAG: TonB-dependent receptor [Pontixanthobacter sp.]
MNYDGRRCAEPLAAESSAYRNPSGHFQPLTFTLFMVLALTPSPILAQEGTITTTSPEAAMAQSEIRRTFLRSEFERFAPSTALDIVLQVPAFTIQEADGGRGLGQASSNVLLNGQRLISKSLSVRQQLQQISAASVERIEIVDGASLNIPGLTGQVANVITRTTSLSGNYSWSPGIDVGGRFVPTEGALSVTGAFNAFSYNAALSNDTSLKRKFTGGLQVKSDQGSVLQDRAVGYRTRYDEPKASASLSWEGPNGITYTIRGSYQVVSSKVAAIELERVAESDLGSVQRGSDNTFTAFEIGAEAGVPLRGGILKLTGLRRHDIADLDQSQTFIPRIADPRTGSRFLADRREVETIGRAEYSWTAGTSSFQINGEAAFNTLDTDAELFILNSVGELVREPFPSASGNVAEERFEAGATHGRPLTDRLALQVTLGAEYSKLSTEGVNASEREFYRPKGALSLTWKQSDDLTLSLLVERSVGQLRFSDFLAQVFLSDDRENTGNADLRPPQTLRSELEAIKGFGTFGNAKLTLYNDQIDDLVDVIFTGTGESPGNLDSAYRRGAELDATLQLAPFGLDGAKLDANVRYQDSNVLDPSTGTNREISFTREWFVGMDFRHDIAGSDIAYGFGLDYGTDYPFFRVFETGLLRDTQYLNTLFVEHKDVLGLKVIAKANNLFGDVQRETRQIFDTRRGTSLATAFRTDTTSRGPFFELTVEGQF